MGIYATKASWQRALGGVVSICVDRRLSPDLFTYGALGLSFSAALALAFAPTNRAWLWLVAPCLLMRLVLNLMDGQVARAQGLADRWGEVKNEFGDRMADASVFLGFCWGGYADARLAALVIALVSGVSYLGILGKALGGARIYEGAFGKGDRMISLALFTLWVLSGRALTDYNLYLAFAALAALLTISQRLRILYEHAQSLR
jgi:CDP-diacylglycerol--glycerol-3-phosphate 3-phosphatidyltransferase